MAARRSALVSSAFCRIPPRDQNLRVIERPDDVQLLDRRAVVEQRLELDLSRAQVDQGSLHVGFELDALQLQAVEVHLRDIARLVPVAAHSEHAVIELEALARDRHHSLLLEHLHEGAAQIEKQVPLLIIQFRDGDCGALPRALAPQVALVPPLNQVAAGKKWLGVGKRPVGSVGLGGGD